MVKKAAEIKKVEVGGVRRREENVRMHSRRGTVRRVPEREKMVVEGGE